LNKVKDKKMRNLRSFLVLFASVFIMVSCNDSSDDPALQALGDVYVRCMKVGDKVQYAPVYNAFSNYIISSSSVETPDGNSIKLKATEGGGRVFNNLSSGPNYSSDDVENGTYTFTVTNSAKGKLVVKDKLLEGRLDPIEIAKFNYNSSTKRFTIDWNDVEGKDIYTFKIMTEIDGEVLFVSIPMYNSEINPTDVIEGRRYGNIVEGKTYVVGIFAYKFEQSNIKSGQQINCESVAYRTIKW